MTRLRQIHVLAGLILALQTPLLGGCVTTSLWSGVLSGKAVDPELAGTIHTSPPLGHEPRKLAVRYKADTAWVGHWGELGAFPYIAAVPLDQAEQPVAPFRYDGIAITLEAVARDVSPEQVRAVREAVRREGLLASLAPPHFVDCASDDSVFTMQCVTPPRPGEKREVFVFAYWRREPGEPGVRAPGGTLPTEARIVVLPSSAPAPLERLGAIPILIIGSYILLPFDILISPMYPLLARDHAQAAGELKPIGAPDPTPASQRSGPP